MTFPALPPRRVRYGAAVYGSFLVAATVGLAFEAGESARAMTASTFASMLIFWLAHAWAEVLGESITVGDRFRPRDALGIAQREWPLVEAGVVPTLLLALAWAGVWSRHTGALLALAAAILQITVWGVISGRRTGGSWRKAGILGAVQGALGVLLLVLEGFVH